LQVSSPAFCSCLFQPAPCPFVIASPDLSGRGNLVWLPPRITRSLRNLCCRQLPSSSQCGHLIRLALLIGHPCRRFRQCLQLHPFLFFPLTDNCLASFGYPFSATGRTWSVCRIVAGVRIWSFRKRSNIMLSPRCCQDFREIF